MHERYAPLVERIARGFSYRDENLECGGVALQDVASAVGTPCYVYNLNGIVETYKEYEDALSRIRHITCYAVKANSNLAVLQQLDKAGCGFDVNSRGELYRALRAGAPVNRITMTGIGKSEEDIRDALQAGILYLNAESYEECVRIQYVAALMGAVARVVLRINPDVDAHTHPYIATGLANHKFGLSPEDAMAALPKIAALQNIELLGYGMHLGSQIFTASTFVEGMRRLVALCGRTAQYFSSGVQVLNLGGGIGVPYRVGEEAMAPQEFASAVETVLRETPIDPFIVTEPGRYFTAGSGVLLTKVEYIKQTSRRTFIITDAGMNDLIRPALYEAHHEILPVLLHDSMATGVADVVGPVCESSDTFAVQRSLPLPAQGDCLAIFSSGAYGSVMSSRYNSRPFCAEVGVMDGQWKVIRERDTFESLVHAERMWSNGS